jgi:hypothetical protein
MASVTVTKIVKEASRVLVYFGKDCREFSSLSEMQQLVRANLTRSDLMDIALGLMLSRQPALGNPTVFEGKSVNVDFSATNWGTLS